MPKGSTILHLCLGERNLTHFGGIFLIHPFCKKLRLKWHLQKQVHFSQHFTYFHPVDLILAIIYALIAGIHRLSKTKILQGNGAFQQIIGLKKFQAERPFDGAPLAQLGITPQKPSWRV